MIRSIVLENKYFDLFYDNEYGIEKESLRVREKDDFVTLTDHPHSLGSRSTHPYIQTDYSESQPELITPPFANFYQALDFLKTVNAVLYQEMDKGEYLWPMSIPPHLPEDQAIRISESSPKELRIYREYTGEKYGRSRQLICGLHLNYSLRQEFIQALFEKQDQYQNITSFQNYVYMKLSRNFLRYQWILIYLFGATPLAGEDFIRQNKMLQGRDLKNPMRSIRNSSFGFLNGTDVKVRYDQLENYIFDIEENVKLEKLKAEREYYGDVRLKGGVGRQLRELLESGIYYLEFRSMDLNPYSPLGLEGLQIDFIHVFFLYLIWIEETDEIEVVEEGMQRTLNTAEEHPHQASQYKEDGIDFVQGIKEMLEEIGKVDEMVAVNFALEAFNDPQKTVASCILEDVERYGSLVKFGHQLGLDYKKEALEQPLKLDSFEKVDKKDLKLILNGIKEGKSWEDLQKYFK